MGFNLILLKFLSKWKRDVDLDLLFTIFVLTIIGLFAVLTSNQSMAKRINISNLALFKKHIIFSFIGFFLMLLFSMFSFDFINTLSKFMIILCFTAIILTIFFGSEIKGSRRWLDVSFLSLQPGEILKPFFFVFQGSVINSKNFIWSRITIYISILLFFLQPDIGTAMLYLSVSLIQLFLSYAKKELIFLMFSGFILLGSFAYILLPHVYSRINIFAESKLGYQTYQSISAIQNGGYFGIGAGNGVVKYNIPDSYTDYIFSVLFEELGFFFCLIILFLYGKLFFGSLIKMRERFMAKIDFNLFNLGVSLISILFLQTFVNISVAVNLLPSKGMTLPLISYGGSSILSTYIILGIILAILRNNNQFNNKYAI